MQRAEAEHASETQWLAKRSRTSPAEAMSTKPGQYVTETSVVHETRPTTPAISPSSVIPLIPSNRVPTPLVMAHPFCLQVETKQETLPRFSQGERGNHEVSAWEGNSLDSLLQELPDDNLVIPRALDDASDTPTNGGGDAGGLDDEGCDLETLDGTEAVALVSLQLLSEQLKKQDSSSPRTQALIRAITDLTQCLQNGEPINGSMGLISNQKRLSPTSAQATRPSPTFCTHGESTDGSAAKKPPRPPPFRSTRPPTSPSEHQNVPAGPRFTTGRTQQSNPGSQFARTAGEVNSFYENTQPPIPPPLPPKPKATSTPQSRPANAPMAKKSSHVEGLSPGPHRELLENAISQMAASMLQHGAIGTAGPSLPKRPPPPKNGFQKPKLVGGHLDGQKQRPVNRRRRLHSEETDTDSSPSSSSSSFCSKTDGLCCPRPTPRHTSSNSLSSRPETVQAPQFPTLTSVSSFDHSDSELDEPAFHVRQVDSRSEQPNDAYEPIAFDETFRKHSPKQPKKPTRKPPSSAQSRQAKSKGFPGGIRRAPCGPSQIRTDNTGQHNRLVSAQHI